MRHLLPEDLALALNKLLSLFIVPILPPLISGGDNYINSTSGITIDLDKQWVVIIDVFVIRVRNFPLPPLCTLYH